MDTEQGVLEEANWSSGARIAAIVVAALAGSLLLIGTRHGVGVSPDGVTYLHQAEVFADRGALYVTEGGSPTHFPPGWGLAVGAVTSVTGSSALTAIRIFNFVALIVLVLLSCRAMAGTGQRIGWLQVIAAVYFCFLYAVQWTAQYALTETTFLVLVILALVLLERFDRTERHGFLIGAAALAAASTLVRYVGVVLLVSLIVSILRSKWGMSRLAPLAGVSAIVLGPILLWVLAAPESRRPSIHVSSPSTAGLDDVWLSLERLGLAVAHWDIPKFEVLYGVAGVAAIAIPILAALTIDRVGPPNGPDTARPGVDPLNLMPWVVFGASYIALVATQRWWIDREIIERYWVPFILVAIVLTVRTVEDLRHRVRFGPRLFHVTLLALGVAASLNLAQAVEFAENARAEGLGYNSVSLRASPVVRAIRESSSQRVLTDSPTAIRYHAPAKMPQDIRVDPVRDLQCKSISLGSLGGSDFPVPVALLSRCNSDEVVAEILAEFPLAEVLEDPESEIRLIILVSR